MLLLPIGHDQSIRRFPWVTVAVMVLCTLLQVQRTIASPSSHEVAELIAERQAKEQAVVEMLLLSQPSVVESVPPQVLAHPEMLVELVRQKKLGDPRHPAVEALFAVDARIEALRTRDLAMRWGYRPDDPWSINAVLAAFVHGGWLHLAGNLLFLWLCGCNLEDRWGRPVFGVFYLFAALVASFAYALFHPGGHIPMVGASGAIAGGMGAFLICYYDANIRYFWLWGFRHGVVTFPAYVAFPVWFFSQLLQSFFEMSGTSGVAYSAHVGGFVFGVAFAAVLRFSKLEAKVLLPATAKGVEWEEDPDFVRAMEIARTEPKAAIELLRKAIAKDPKRDDVRIELCRAAIADGDADLVDSTATRTFLALGEQQRWPEVVEMYLAFEARAFKKPLSDRAYSVVVRAAIESNEPKLCVRAATSLQNAHPTSPLMPRALWDVATAQRTAGRIDLSHKTLRRLVESYPQHAFAGEAKKQLESA